MTETRIDPKRSLSCLMNTHDICQHPDKPHIKPGTIPGTGGKLCECECHVEQKGPELSRPSDPALWPDDMRQWALEAGYIRRPGDDGDCDNRRFFRGGSDMSKEGSRGQVEYGGDRLSADDLIRGVTIERRSGESGEVFVLKTDGLSGGKGVYIDTLDKLLAAVPSYLGVPTPD